jgi:hypothetical protein
VVELSNGLLQIQRAGDWNADGGPQSAGPDNRWLHSPQQQASAAEDHIEESGQRCSGIDGSRISKGSYGHDRCRKRR